MKQKILFRIVFLALTAFVLSFAACQDENANVNDGNGTEMSKAEYDALLNQFKSKVDAAIDTRVATVTENLNANLASYEEVPDDVDLQKSIVTSAIEIEMANLFKTRAGQELDQHRGEAVTPCAYELKSLVNSDFETIYPAFDVSILGVTVDHRERQLIKRDVLIDKFNTIISYLTYCVDGGDPDLTDLINRITDLETNLAAHIDLMTVLLGITEEGKSTVLDDITDSLQDLQDFKANKFKYHGKWMDLKDVFNELKDIEKELRKQIKENRIEIKKLKERVTYIEDVEIPAIWENMEFLYDLINDVYNNLDRRVTGLTFKPDYDFADGLSSLILVRGLSEWKPDGAYKWDVKQNGTMNKGVTWLKYNVSPSNAKYYKNGSSKNDFDVIDLLYTTTTLVTKSSSDADSYLEILRDKISYDKGILSVPVVIRKDKYPLDDPGANKSVKVALRIGNKGYEIEEMPERPEQEEPMMPMSVDSKSGSDNRYVVSTEYVTLWMGLFDGRIALKDKNAKPDKIGEILPTEIDRDMFIDKTDNTYPTLELATDKKHDLANDVLDVFFDGFEKAYRLPDNYNFNRHDLSFELVALNNGADNLFTLKSNGEFSISKSNQQKAIGTTACVLIKAKYHGNWHAIGYLRIRIVKSDKESFTITDKFNLDDAVLNCGEWNEFTKADQVRKLVKENILKTYVSEKTGITDLGVFFQKYTGIEVTDVSVTNNYADLSSFEGDLKDLVSFEYIGGANPYYKGTISPEAPFGTYIVQTTLMSDDLIPDLLVIWKFTVKTPQLQWQNLPSGDFVINSNTPDMNAFPIVQTYSAYNGSISGLFKKLPSGGFDYKNLAGQDCGDYVTPNFIFFKAPAGFDISADGRSLTKGGVTVAVIEELDGDFTIRLIQNAAVDGIVGSNDIRVIAKGTVNDIVYTIYNPFKVKFATPLKLVFPTNATFGAASGIFQLVMYNNNNGVTNVIQDFAGNELTTFQAPKAVLFVEHYGVDYTYDTSLIYNSSPLYAPVKFDLANVAYNQNVAGIIVQIESFTSGDVTTYDGMMTPLRYKFKIVDTLGNGIPSGLIATIPVTLKYGWGYIHENLVITKN